MLTDVYRKDIDELYQTSIVQQTAFWSIVKSKVGLDSIALNYKSKKSSIYHEVTKDATIHSDILVILQRLNSNRSIAYVPYGPELEPEEDFQGAFLEELSESLRSYLPKDCLMVRYDLGWESFWAKEQALVGAGELEIAEPSIKSQEIRLNINTHNWNLHKAHTNILPTNTLYIDLQPDLDTILERMKPKTRYNIRLAQRKGVQVRVADLNELDIWYNLYRETALRNGLYLNDIKYFKAILTANADNTKSPADVYYLIAEVDNKPLAALFLTITGNRSSYLYGASSSANRNFMATYALQWFAMKLSKEKGCVEYDMFGVAPRNDADHPLYGLYKFKTGFGGEFYHSLGCWDYPFVQKDYDLFKNLERLNQGYHMN